MSNDIYKKLAALLDKLPNGYAPTKDGIEIELLKEIFTEEQAELYCYLRLEFETAEQIAERAGLPLEGLEEKLTGMVEDGQIMGFPLGGIYIFKMMPFLFGIWEGQLKRLDKKKVELFEKYYPDFGKPFFTEQPQQFRILPIEEEISETSQALPYDKVSSIVENGQSFGIGECICKKEQALNENPCDRPLEVCMAIAPIEGVFDETSSFKAVTKDEAKATLKEAEEEALVHLTSNYQNGTYFICNCCGCCCGVLRGITHLGIPASLVVNSDYYAVVNEDNCTLCGICKDERCQVEAIEEGVDTYRIIKDRCIGCGLCISTCEDEAIQMVRKKEAEITPPPVDETAWFVERGKMRGVDFSEYQ